jgi:hypothetical protein
MQSSKNNLPYLLDRVSTTAVLSAFAPRRAALDQHGYPEVVIINDPKADIEMFENVCDKQNRSRWPGGNA